MIVLDYFNRILNHTTKYGNNKDLQRKKNENLIQYYPVVDFR